MKFYILTDADDVEVAGCYATLDAAIEQGNDLYAGDFEIRVEEVEVTTDSIRRLLGSEGGYCKHMWRMEYRDGKCTNKRKAF